MNKHLHRIVFNAARGLRMVVQETARSAGKATGATSGVLVTALAALLAVSPAPAQIVGAPGVLPNLRPTVLVAPNGVPLVNIQTPSAAGVSRNLYHQFDVSSRGVILNNSRTDVQTQLGGWVQGNPYLATGPARIILNEITSGNPTQLRGAIEVGGQRAEVIVANPAGIAVDGGTFINASRATLTTGTPQLNAFGGLDGYVVRGGTVTIDGAGLDARSTDYTAILARAAQINAGLWANELKIVTGANRISADHAQATPTAGTGPAPVFALDVAQLGGMYAGKIHLIGTEAGLGARNAGTIQAAGGDTLAGPGEFVVTAAGRLENIGTMQAASRGDITAASLANSGRIAAGQDLRIATQGTLGNAGGTLEAQSLQLASAGDLDNRGGTMRQTSGVGLTLTAPALSNTAGGVIGAEPVPETPTQPGVGTGTGTSGPATPETATGTGTTLGTETGIGSNGATSSPSYVPAPGVITASGSVLNDGGRIHAGGSIQLQTPQVNNSSGSIATTSLAASGPSFSNAGGTLHVTGRFSANVDRFDNTGGILRAGGLQIASSGDLVNQDGQLVSDGDATLSAGASVNNTRGTLLAAGNATLQGASIDLSTSTTSATNIALTANQGHVTTSGATVTTPGTLSVTANSEASQTLVNQGGKLNAGQLNLAVSNLANTSGGEIVQTGTGATTIATSGAIDNSGGRIATNAQDLTLDAAAGLTNTGGKIEHAGSGTLRIAGSRYSGANGELIGNGALIVNVAGAFNQDSGSTSARQITIDAGSLSNQGGRIVQATMADTRISVVGAIDNTAGTIASNGHTTIAAGSLSNQGGTIRAAESANLGLTTGGLLDNSGQGEIGSGGTVTLNAGNRNGALIFSGGDLFIGGALSADGKAIGTAGALNNHAATIEALRNVDIRTGVLNNTNGGVTWTTQTSPAVHRIEYALPGSATRYNPSQLVFATTVGPTMEFEKMMGILWPVFGSAAGAIGNPNYGILVPSAAYPLSRFKPYYDYAPRNSVELHGERAVGTDQTEHFSVPGAWYSRNDPIWATFGVVPPDTDTPSGDAQQQAYLEAHQRLDAATSAFIGDVYRNLSRAYSYWVYDESTTTPVLQTSAPARILSGGAMNIAVGSGTNDMSQIVAGGALTVTGGAIQNKNLEVHGSLNQVGVQGFHPGPSGSEQFASYNLSVPTTVTLGAARQEGNTAPGGTGTQIGASMPGHTNQAVAGTGGANAAVQLGTGGGAGSAVSAPGASSATGAGAAVSPIVQVRLAASSNVVRTTLPGLNVPSASLFRNHPEPGSRYLVETDPRFANYRSWLSSDYVLERLGLDPDLTQKRLGDGYYEQRLVREQIAQLTGQRYLDGYASDEPDPRRDERAQCHHRGPGGGAVCEQSGWGPGGIGRA